MNKEIKSFKGTSKVKKQDTTFFNDLVNYELTDSETGKVTNFLLDVNIDYYNLMELGQLSENLNVVMKTNDAKEQLKLILAVSKTVKKVFTILEIDGYKLNKEEQEADITNINILIGFIELMGEISKMVQKENEVKMNRQQRRSAGVSNPELNHRMLNAVAENDELAERVWNDDLISPTEKGFDIEEPFVNLDKEPYLDGKMEHELFKDVADRLVTPTEKDNVLNILR